MMKISAYLVTLNEEQRLEKTLKAVAHDYESRMKLSLEVMLKVIEPLMIAFVGLIVLYVAVNGYKAYYGYIYSLL